MTSLRASMLKTQSSMTRATSIINLNNSCYGSSFNTAPLSSISSSSVHSAVNNSNNSSSGGISHYRCNSHANLPTAPSISSGIGSIVHNSSSSNVLSSSAEVSDCGSSGLIVGVSSPPTSAPTTIVTTTTNTLTICNNNNNNNHSSIDTSTTTSQSSPSSTSSSNSSPSSQNPNNISRPNTPHLAFKNMFSFHNPITTTTRSRADSVANSLSTNVDIENPQVWNNHPLVISADDSLVDQNKSLFHRYSLRLPSKLESEFLDHHYNSQIFLLRITNLIGILCVSYGFTKPAMFMLIAVRVLCFNSFVDSKRLQKKAESLKIEKEKSEQLLSNILPDFVIKMMKDYTPTANLDILNNYLTSTNSPLPPISKDFPDCSILYCDIVEFTSLASRVSPEQLVRLLNEVFTEFDKVVDSHKCEKIKTDGDAYVCAGGLTIENNFHYKAIVDIAIDILRLPILSNNCLNVQVKIRVGVATGSVIGGVIGCEKFQFDVWGEAIAMAHTLEQNGSAGQIHITERGLDKLNLDDYVLNENLDCSLGVTTYFIKSSKHQNQNNGANITSNGATINMSLAPPQPNFFGNQDEFTKEVVSFDSTTGEKSTHISIDTTSCSASSSSMSLPSSTASTPRNMSIKKPPSRKNEKLGDIILRPIRHGFFRKEDMISPPKEDAIENTEVDRYFKEYTKLNHWIVQFRNLFVEMEYHKYVINSTVFETKFFIIIGVVLHVVFYLDDYLMGSNPVFGARSIYLAMGLLFILYFAMSFIKFFKRVYVYQVMFFLLLLVFGITTILELLRYDNPLARSSLTRVCATLFYVNVFHSLNFISVAFLNIFIFAFFFICAYFLSPSLTQHLYGTDYMGIIIVLIIQICSSYGMKLGMRRAWVIKSKVKYKGLILQKERERSSRLLGNILPTSISERLMKEGKGKGNGMLIAQKYSHVAIMFINIIGFEKLPVQLEASVMVSHMNYIFSIFDGQLARYELEKIKTIGTTYMVVSGLNTSQSPKIFLSNMANMALTAKAYVKHIDENLNVQIGISFGPCVAGCIGIQRAKFDVWGDTANIASRMQTSAPPGKIQVTKEVSKVLKRGFFLEERGVIKVKGKGDMISYYLTGKRGSTDSKIYDNDGGIDQLPNHWKLLQFPSANSCNSTPNESNINITNNNTDFTNKETLVEVK
ncbi:adenylyl cyclase [Heterostelium album PN500]|uniref:adenylate cyclase n=1 Tax=Heterostelium pallidum (strain ATCC 26659 / Pp 5 / PN500) TaxID=670386 RepID=D3B043_HETP5|nr:adenylyl cyclase [Heterostelium album PN500]EFA84667.1 adenylyl cyclase [Heterostelium album PN500]|eukprot:XP_020436780.1 adenylyl cyclase [Heterostelium album PN500]